MLPWAVPVFPCSRPQAPWPHPCHSQVLSVKPTLAIVYPPPQINPLSVKPEMGSGRQACVASHVSSPLDTLYLPLSPRCTVIPLPVTARSFGICAAAVCKGGTGLFLSLHRNHCSATIKCPTGSATYLGFRRGSRATAPCQFLLMARSCYNFGPHFCLLSLVMGRAGACRSKKKKKTF